jgi:hypothetical protein
LDLAYRCQGGSGRKTSKSRKGTSAGRIRAIFKVADPDWARERILGGMSSGEGA